MLLSARPQQGPPVQRQLLPLSPLPPLRPPCPYSSLYSFTYGSVRFKDSSDGNYKGSYKGVGVAPQAGVDAAPRNTFNFSAGRQGGYDDYGNSGDGRGSAGQYPTVRSCQ